jgi:hypothetical protein
MVALQKVTVTQESYYAMPPYAKQTCEIFPSDVIRTEEQAVTIAMSSSLHFADQIWLKRKSKTAEN